jgi:hypothetical protein
MSASFWDDPEFKSRLRKIADDDREIMSRDPVNGPRQLTMRRIIAKLRLIERGIPLPFAPRRKHLTKTQRKLLRLLNRQAEAEAPR